MSNKKRIAAKEGWYSIDPANPHLLGSKCKSCGTYSFPAETVFCKNPACDSSEFAVVPLSTRGRIWSYTNACYQPPAPYIAKHDPYQPFALAAVELEKEKLIVLGQMVEGVQVSDLKIGQPVDLVLDILTSDATTEQIVWRWQPAKD